MTVLTDTFSAGSSLSARFATLRAQYAENAAKRKVFRTTFNELQNLTSRELADLGIDRSQIKSIAFEAAYGA